MAVEVFESFDIILASTNIFKSSLVFQNQAWYVTGTGLTKPNSLPVLKNNKIVVCESVFLFKCHVAFDSFLHWQSAMHSKYVSGWQGVSLLTFVNNKFLVSHLSVRGEIIYFDVDISNTSSYQGHLFFKKKKQFDYEAAMKTFLFPSSQEAAPIGVVRPRTEKRWLRQGGFHPHPGGKTIQLWKSVQGQTYILSVVSCKDVKWCCGEVSATRTCFQ